MNVYTSDGLLVRMAAEDGSEDTGLTAEQGQQLISVYRLFLRLHHAGASVPRVKDMLRPDPNTGGHSGDHGGSYELAGAGGSAGAATYANSVALVSPDTPYPMFLLSSNALPESHRLRGFPATVPAAAPLTAVPKNNNRSANGCEEIPLRWGLLSKQAPSSLLNPGTTPAVTATAANAGAGVGNGMSAPTTAGGAVAHVVATSAGLRDGTESPAGVSTSSAASGGTPLQPIQPVTPPSGPQAYPSGWMPAELQVHTTKQVLCCTAAEMSLDVDGGAEDGHAPLLFLCSAQPNAA